MKNNYLSNLEIIKNCPNYYNIIDTEIYEGDKITEKLIKIYLEYIFSVDIKYKESINKLKSIDSVVMKYLTDHRFKKELSTSLTSIKVSKNEANVIQYIVTKLIDITEEYTNTCTRKIYIPRWI